MRVCRFGERRIPGRVRIPPEARWLFRGDGKVWQIFHAGNRHCLYLALIRQLGLPHSPVDVRRAVGAWILLNPFEMLPGGISVTDKILAEHGAGVEEYVRWLVDPQREADDERPGARGFALGTDIEIFCLVR